MTAFTQCLILFRNFSFHDVHTKGAQTIAKICAESGVSRLVHISHLNASHESPSAFYRSKAEGEELVREAFPNATIIRPGTLFGYEDKFLNNMAGTFLIKIVLNTRFDRQLLVWPVWWKLNNGHTKTRPVHVMDVASVLTNLMTMPVTPGTFSLPGPASLNNAYILDLIRSLTYSTPSTAPVMPKAIAKAIARAAQATWWPLISPDEVERRYIDDADTAGDWSTFGVEPAHIEQLALTYVRRYRSAYDLPVPVFSVLMLTCVSSENIIRCLLYSQTVQWRESHLLPVFFIS